MDESVSRSDLPQAYADALALRDAGCSHEEIADRLRVPTIAIASMLMVAEAKLTSARTEQCLGDAGQ